MRASFSRWIVVGAAALTLGALVVGCRPAEAPAVATDDPWAGTWTLNLVKSTYSLSPAPRSAITRLEPLDGGWQMSQEVVGADGAVTKEQFLGTFDGQDHLIAPGGRVTIALTKVDDRTVDVVMKHAGVVTTTRLVVSPDGKTQTSTTTGLNAQGQTASNVAVYDKP